MDAFSQLDKVASKRSALEKLIDIAIGIQGQQQAMEDLSLIAKPSQEFPAKTLKYMTQFEEKHADEADEQLRQRLGLIESTIHVLIERVVLFAQLEVTALRDEEVKGHSVEDFKQLVAEFEQHTKTSLILRFLLKKRGVALAAFKLPFSQDSVAERIQALKEKENQCIAQIKAEAQSIIDDTRVLLAGSSFPEKMREQLQAVQEAMQDNLLHLNSGGSVATLPNKFEVIESQSPPAAVAEERVKEVETSPKSAKLAVEVKKSAKTLTGKVPAKSARAIRPKKLTTWQLLLKWLMTPWSQSFKSLKEENEKNSD